MREGIGLVGIFQIVIVFILLFTGLMAFTINNTNAFGVKNEIVNIINFNNGSISLSGDRSTLDEDIVKVMEDNSYRNSGKCSDGFKGFDIMGNSVADGAEASLCIKCVTVTSGNEDYLTLRYGDNVATGNALYGFYYQVQLFYKLDIPVIKETFNFNTIGETKTFYNKVLPGVCIV